jgi:hypothetical protein
MAEIDLEKTEKLINSLSNLIEKLEKLPIALEVIYVISGAVICAFIYFMTKMVLEHKKGSKLDRVIEKNTEIIGECKEAMRNVCNALERL